MVEMHISYDGELRCSATHGPSGAVLRTDAPVDNHGKGECFSPTDLLATAALSCMLTIMGIHAQRDGIDLQGTTGSVSKHMSSDTPRRVARLDISITFGPAVPAASKAALEAAAIGCPVMRSIHPDITVAHEFV